MGIAFASRIHDTLCAEAPVADQYRCAMTRVGATTMARPRIGARIATVAVPAAVALGMAAIRGDQVPLWRDEFATAMFASLSPMELLAATSHVDAVLAPYYFLMHLLSPLLGLELGMRVVSVLAFVGTAATIAAVALRWWGTVAGVVAGSAVALNGEVLAAAVNARPYALSLFFGALTLLAANRAITSRLAGAWVAYAAAAAAAVALQLFAALAVASIGVLLVRRPRSTVVRWIVATIPACVVAVVLLIAGLGHRGQLAWLGAPDIREAILLVARTSGVSAERAVAFDVVTLVILMATSVASIAAARLSGSDAAEGVRTRAFAITLLLAPPLVLLVFSLAVTPVFAGRYFIWSSVGAALVLGGAAAQIVRPRTPLGSLAASVAAVLLVLSAVTAGIRLANPPARGDNFPAAVRSLARDAERGDMLVIAQPYAFGGVAYGFAVSAGDEAHAVEVAQRAVTGSQPVLDMRTITDVDPFRSETVLDAPLAAGPLGVIWVMTIFPITDEQLSTVPGTIGECLEDLDFENPTERYGAVRLFRLDCG